LFARAVCVSERPLIPLVLGVTRPPLKDPLKVDEGFGKGQTKEENSTKRKILYERVIFFRTFLSSSRARWTCPSTLFCFLENNILTFFNEVALILQLGLFESLGCQGGGAGAINDRRKEKERKE
jgi:hypothetical protein